MNDLALVLDEFATELFADELLTIELETRELLDMASTELLELVVSALLDDMLLGARLDELGSAVGLETAGV